jgi:transposase InsO family protein
MFALDSVNRQFEAERPNQLWVSDFTYVSHWQGWVSVVFVISGGRSCENIVNVCDLCAVVD